MRTPRLSIGHSGGISFEKGVPRARNFDAVLEPLEDEALSPAERISRVYAALFAGRVPAPRVMRLVNPSTWPSPDLVRAVASVREIVVRYVHYFQDPRELPVTHYRKQKAVAIHLDAEFGPLLRELVLRSGREALREADGTPAKDAFLDKPILFLKEEARAKKFPKTKGGEGVSIDAVRARFVAKLEAKGAFPEALARQDAEAALRRDLQGR